MIAMRATKLLVAGLLCRLSHTVSANTDRFPVSKAALPDGLAQKQDLHARSRNARPQVRTRPEGSVTRFDGNLF